MSVMSRGTALRQLREAHAALKKVRQLMRQAREDNRLVPEVLDTGWECLVRAHQTMAAIPRDAVDETVMTQQLSLQRYATALLVRLRRLMIKGGPGSENEDSGRHDLDDDD